MQKIFDSIESIKTFVGQPTLRGKAMAVDQDMINIFAGVTQDQQWIHVDPQRAATESPFKTTTAHGLLTPSLRLACRRG